MHVQQRKYPSKSKRKRNENVKRKKKQGVEKRKSNERKRKNENESAAQKNILKRAIQTFAKSIAESGAGPPLILRLNKKSVLARQ